ncbi:MAG: hypothetical protein IJ759_02090 [Bacteroidales bacterium]|nr:hypothetical protein [Bacteroidales bacterium]
MYKSIKTIAAIMLLTAGTITFTSCNDEDEISKRDSLKKTESVIDLSRFEDIEDSTEDIFRKTVTFSNGFNGDSLRDMSIKDALITMETFWNYGIVAKQSLTVGDSYSEQVFRFSVPVQEEDGTIEGSTLRSHFKLFLRNVFNAMQGKCLNVGDFSVTRFENNIVTFQLVILPFTRQPNILHDQLGPKATYMKNYGDAIYVPSNFTINPNDWELGGYDEEGEATITNLIYYMQQTQHGVTVNIRSTDITADETIYPYERYITDINHDNFLLKTDYDSVDGSGPYYPIVTSHEIETRIIPSYLKYIKRVFSEYWNIAVSIDPTGQRKNIDDYAAVVHDLGYSLGYFYQVGCIIYDHEIPRETFTYKYRKTFFGHLETSYDWFSSYFSFITLDNNVLAL